MSTGLAIVRSIGSPRRLSTPTEEADFEQELVDQWALAMAAAGCVDSYVHKQRSVVMELLRFVGRPPWTVQPEDLDRFVKSLRADRQAPSTIKDKAWGIARFYDFLIARYGGDIHALTGYQVDQPVDEFNRPAKTDYQSIRVPPCDEDVEHLFSQWRSSLPQSRKYLPAARDYLAASLWRRIGLRINETVMLDVRDWRPDLGPAGKLHIRFGKGSQGRGPKSRMVPGINEVAPLLTWWLTDVRHQYDDEWSAPDAPLLPSERRDPGTGRSTRIGANALRTGMTTAVETWLPAWQGRLTPHGLRHYCASSLYTQGVGLQAIQQLLGHTWLSTTTTYVHVQDQHVEAAWNQANQRVTARLTGG